MITISVCMIVKNEECVLERCLKSFADLVEEIIIVDTGSTDRTKEIAAKYTDKIYDFAWQDDFAAARNFSFSKATKEYIYVADADEIIDEENRKKFWKIKQVLLPEIEVVQMYYTNQLECGSTYNFDQELRPKLYKRLRPFQWVDQIHETVEVRPVVYDSDIEIIHKPIHTHAKRDFTIFQKILAKGERLSAKLVNLYVRELFIAGTDQDFLQAYDYFQSIIKDAVREEEVKEDARCMLVKASRLAKEETVFFQQVLYFMTKQEVPAEVYYEVGEYFFERQEQEESVQWYENALYGSDSFFSLKHSREYPLKRLIQCMEFLGRSEDQKQYEEMLQNVEKTVENTKEI